MIERPLVASMLPNIWSTSTSSTLSLHWYGNPCCEFRSAIYFMHKDPRHQWNVKPLFWVFHFCGSIANISTRLFCILAHDYMLLSLSQDSTQFRAVRLVSLPLYFCRLTSLSSYLGHHSCCAVSAPCLDRPSSFRMCVIALGSFVIQDASLTFVQAWREEAQAALDRLEANKHAESHSSLK